MTIILIIIALILSVAGIAGCILPVIPGPILSFIALILLSFAKDWQAFSITFLIIMAAITILLQVLDIVIPAIGAKKYGASKLGIWGSVAGMLVGMFFIPPWGIFIGAFIGAIAGELIIGRHAEDALRVGWGIFIGNMANIGIKLAFTFAVLFIYIQQIAFP